MPNKKVTISELKRQLDKKAKKNNNDPITSTRINNAYQAAKYRTRGKGKKQKKQKKQKNKKTKKQKKIQ